MRYYLWALLAASVIFLSAVAVIVLPGTFLASSLLSSVRPPPASEGVMVGVPVTGCSPSENADFEARVLELINRERSRHGAPALTLQSQLSAAAFAHSTDMACKGFFSHTDPDGKTVYDHLKEQGYRYTVAAENIYVRLDLA